MIALLYWSATAPESNYLIYFKLAIAKRNVQIHSLICLFIVCQGGGGITQKHTAPAPLQIGSQPPGERRR